MKLNIDKASLLGALERASTACGASRGHTAYTGKVLLDGSIEQDGTQMLRAYGTDGVVQIDTVAEAAVEQTGTMAVDCRKAISMVNAMPTGRIVIESRPSKLQITSAGGPRSFAMPALPGEDYPAPVEPPESATRCAVAGKLLSRNITRVQHILDSTTPNHLQGVWVETDKDLLHTVAITSYCFAFASTQVGEVEAGWAGLLPTGALKLIASYATDDLLTLISDGPRTFVETEDTLIGSLTTEGNYPPWRKMREHQLGNDVARVPYPDVLEALKAVVIGRVDSVSPVRMTVKGTELTFTLEEDPCDARDSVLVDPLGNDDYSVLMDPLFLAEIVRGADSQFVLRAHDQGPLISTDDGYMALAAKRREQPPPPKSKKKS